MNMNNMNGVQLCLIAILIIQIIALIPNIQYLRKSRKIKVLIEFQKKHFNDRGKLVEEMQKYFDHDGSVDQDRFNGLCEQIREMDEKYNDIMGISVKLIDKKPK